MPLPSDPVRITPPAAPLISLAEAKAFLRVEHDEDDALISSQVAAAEARLDGWRGILGRCLVSQTWRLAMPAFCGSDIRLPFPDVRAVVIRWRDPDGGVAAISGGDVHLISRAGRSYLRLADGATWPSPLAPRPDAVEIDLEAGFGDPTDVPGPILSAALLMVGDLYRNRETGVVGAVAAEIKMSTTVDALLSPYRMVW